MTKVFIDGSAGTTGLRIHDRIENRADIELISIPTELRKDINARKEAINSADVAFPACRTRPRSRPSLWSRAMLPLSIPPRLIAAMTIGCTALLSSVCG